MRNRLYKLYQSITTQFYTVFQETTSFACGAIQVLKEKLDKPFTDLVGNEFYVEF